MKTNTKFLLAVLSFSTLFAFAGDETALVQSEYVKIQNEFSTSLGRARQSLRDLANERKKAMLSSQNQAKLEAQGIEALKRYDLLLTVRYADEHGQYQPAVEISTKDIENMNKMFEMYLHSTPLIGRISVSHARRMIEWGMTRLSELSKTHGDPTEQNNPELEIIAKQTMDAETKIKTVTELASRLGVRLNESIAQGETTGDRSPASASK